MLFCRSAKFPEEKTLQKCNIARLYGKKDGVSGRGGLLRYSRLHGPLVCKEADFPCRERQDLAPPLPS